MLRLGIVVATVAIIFLLSGAGGVAAEEVETENSGIDTVSAQDVGTVEVTVVDRESGDPIDGVEVTATWDGGQDSDQTRSDGRALIDVPEETTIDFTVEDPNGDYVRNLQPVSEDDVAGGEVTIEMAEPGAIEFTVVDENERPVEDVRLELYHENDFRLVDTANTDGEGAGTVSGIEQRSYDIETERAGYNVVETSVELNESVVTRTIEIESNRVQVNFRVNDDHFEPAQPIEGATIDIESFGTLPPTFSDGTQDQSLPVNDEYRVTINKEGYQTVEERLEVGEEPTSLNVTTQRTPEITIDQLQDAVVVGQPTQVTITDAYGDPVSEASVSLNGNSVGETDSQGQIVFNITEVGESEISATTDGLTASTSVTGVDPDPEPEQVEQPSDDDGTNESEMDDSEADDGSAEGDDAIGPGFGIIAALGALLAVTLLARRR